MVDAKTWLNDNYENKKNSKAIVVKEGTELKGDLEIKDYPDLETVFLPFTKEITKLTISGCPKIQVIFVPGSKIEKIEGLEGLAQLRQLNFGGNQVKEIDISNNNALEELSFRGNPQDFKFTGGFKSLKNLLKLVTWNSADTLSIAEILKELSESELKEVAAWLNLDTESKDIKKLIKDEIDKINSNKQKLSDPDTGLEGIFDKDGKVDDIKLAEIITSFKEGKKYEILVSEPKNDPIKSADKKEIDQGALTKLIEEREKFKGLLDNSGIDPASPNAEQQAKDLKETKDAVDKLGLDPTADIGKQITDMKEKSTRLEIIVKGVYGEKYELERWEMKIEIPTDK